MMIFPLTLSVDVSVKGTAQFFLSCKAGMQNAKTCSLEIVKCHRKRTAFSCYTPGMQKNHTFCLQIYDPNVEEFQRIVAITIPIVSKQKTPGFLGFFLHLD